MLHLFTVPGQLQGQSGTAPSRLNKACRWSARLKVESELLTSAANAIVKTKKFHIRDRGAYSQCGCQVNRIKGTHWVRWKRTSRSVNNVQTDSTEVPVCSGCVQERPAIGGRGFIDFSKRDCTNQHAIALNRTQ
jgi:hypothetical protein